MAQGSEEAAVPAKVQPQAESPVCFSDVMKALRAETDRVQPNNALLEGARSGDYAKVLEALVNGADKTARDAKGNSALHLAVVAGCRKLVEFMIAENFPLDMPNEAGYTPLHCAVSQAHVDVMEDLAVAGADVNHAIPKVKETPLMLAAYRNLPEMVAGLLKHGARVDAQDTNGATASMRAAGQDNAECLRLLMAGGADPYLQSISGSTVFSFAKRARAMGALAFLDSYMPEYTARIAQEGSTKAVSTMKTLRFRKTEYIPFG